MLQELSFGKFVTLMAAIMALNALAIDTMLPALPAIAQSLHILEANQRQWVISAYMLSYAVGQLIYGPISDRFGRRPILLGCLAAYALFSFGAAIAGSFTTLIAARCCQGLASAGARVLSVAIIRDRYAGSRMASVMSLTFIVFLTVPILAPSLGQAVMLVATWNWIFYVLAAFALAVYAYSYLRLPETLHAAAGQTMSLSGLLRDWRIVLSNRVSVGYSIATTFVFGALVGFINSIQQIYSDIFHAPRRFPITFALVAGTMAIMALLNSRIVVRVGMRKVSHTALLVFVLASGAHLLVVLTGFETELSFAIAQSIVMGSFALSTSNFGALSMEPLGSVAGSASSLQGFITTLGGALLGLLIGQSYNQTMVPLTLGYFLCGIVALFAVLITESGKLFAAPADAVAVR